MCAGRSEPAALGAQRPLDWQCIQRRLDYAVEVCVAQLQWATKGTATKTIGIYFCTEIHHKGTSQPTPDMADAS